MKSRNTWVQTLGMGGGTALLLGASLFTSGVRAAKQGTPQRAAEILSLRCLSCHNPEKKSAGLDLSTRTQALAHSGALTPKNPEMSKVWLRVNAGTMPPTGKLSASERETLKAWIVEGATFPKTPLVAFTPTRKPLWSFQPLTNPVVPKSAFDTLSKSPIDRFLFAKMQERGLKPSPPAEKLALLRRITFDLTGLPPSPEEVQAFLVDRSQNAYEKVVDRLLASPAYGERWGRHWLDVVRYGESHGYEQNHLRNNPWVYRDYVIRAFNEDKPFNQFLIEQIAGDIVGKGDPKTEVATGFLVAGIHDTVGISTEEGTRQQRVNDLDDMVTTTGMTFMGMTIGCAKCHDHKFDPIPSRDYYRMAAVFAGVRHSEREIPVAPLTPEQRRTQERLQRGIETATLEAQKMDREAQGNPLPAQASLRAPVDPRHNEENFPLVAAKFLRFVIVATNDGSEPCLDEIQVYAADGGENIALASRGAKASASSLLPNVAIHQIEHLNDGAVGNSKSWISAEAGRGWAQIEFPEVVRIRRVVWGRDGEGAFKDRLATVYHVEVSEDGKAWKTVASSEDRALDLTKATEAAILARMTPEQRTRRTQLQKEIGRLMRERAEVTAMNRAYVGAFSAPDPVYLLNRGDVMQRQDQVSPGALTQIRAFPTELSATKTEPRLALGQWLTDARNPLTARVIVNRIWAQHFGRGIVGTPSDFGANGEKPSHPELLDWLARDFMANGWKIKRLHRQIVTTSAYRRSSASTGENAKRDGDNRYLWRMPLRRLEAEAIRDAILATSGKLDRRVGGPSFQLYKYETVNVAIYTPKEEQGADTWRRCVYQQPARGIRDNLLGSFDCPDSSERAAKRTRTTTALQALSLFNGAFSLQQAEFFAERVQQETQGTAAKQVERAFWLAFGRAPKLEEGKASEALVKAYGLPTLCRALLNANAFLYY